MWELVISLLALDATEPLSQLVTQMAVEIIDIHVISLQKKRRCKGYILFYAKTTKNKFWNDVEMMLKSFWTSHLPMGLYARMELVDEREYQNV